MLGVLVVLGACGKKGPPLAPLRVTPQRIEDLAVLRVGDQVRARLTIPNANDDKTQPADIVAVEVYAISGRPEDPFGQPLDAADFRRFGDLVGRVDVKPPPDTAPEAPLRATPAGTAAALMDTRPGQGEIVTVRETIGAEQMQPFVHPRRREKAEVETDEDVPVRPLAAAPVEEQFSRAYAAMGVNRKGDRSGLSNRVAVPLKDVGLSPPSPVLVTFSETQLTATWTFPKDAATPIQRAPLPEEIPARPLTGGRAANTYNVYELIRKGDGTTVESEQPLNPSPSAADGFSVPLGAFGKERCFVVRSGVQLGNARIEGPASSVACATPVDKFPPVAPKGLAAVGSEGGVSLIWDPNTEADLAGYLVLRGEVAAAGATATLAPITPEPIRETTFRDTTARPGLRYVYAIVAVDGASPRNTSPESERVEEGARN